MKIARNVWYKGEFTRDERTGYGTLVVDGVSTYRGNFRNGKKSGQGRLTMRDGSWYEGRFKDNKKNGKGRFYDANTKKTEKGYWIADDLVTKGSARRRRPPIDRRDFTTSSFGGL